MADVTLIVRSEQSDHEWIRQTRYSSLLDSYCFYCFARYQSTFRGEPCEGHILGEVPWP